MVDITHDDTTDLTTRLSQFRELATLQTVAVNRQKWPYYGLGDTSQEAILVLHGGGGDAEAMFPYLLRLSENFRVIAPNFPPTLRKMDDAVTGLRAVLAHESIERASLLGFSFGAAVAQMFIRKFSDHVLDFIITHATIPSDHLLEYVTMQQALIAFYPAPLMNWFSRRSYRNNIEMSRTPVDDATRAFWQAYFAETIGGRIQKRHLLSRVRMMADYHRGNEFTTKDLNEWQYDMLLIESSHDDAIGEGDRGALKGMYPKAFVQTLWGYDHLAPFLAADELAVSIEKFLLKADLEA